MSNVVKNGVFATGTRYWTLQYFDSSGGNMYPQFVPAEGYPQPGCLFIPMGGVASQQVALAEAGEHRFNFHLRTLEPAAAPGVLYAAVRDDVTLDVHTMRIEIPASDTEWHQQTVVFNLSAGYATVEFLVEDMRSGVWIDSVELIYQQSDFCVPLVRELQQRRDDLFFQKHAEARYYSLVAQAINQAPEPLWKPISYEVPLVKDVQQYGLYNLPGLKREEQVSRVWKKYSTGQVDQVARWECITDLDGVYIFFDEVIKADCLARIEYRPEPEYTCDNPEVVPIDSDWVAAKAMTLLLNEATEDVELEARRLTQLQIWQGEMMKLEAMRAIRIGSGKARNLPSSWFAGAGPQTCAQPTVAPPTAAFVASPTIGGRPLEVRFTNVSSGEIDSYYWQFGDGFVSTEVNPVHTYGSNGYYYPVLTVTGVGGQSQSTVQVITVGVPVADFEVSDAQRSGASPHTVDFINTTDEEGMGEVNYKWTFDWGTEYPHTSTLKNPSYTYPVAGQYSVLLEANSTVDGTKLLRQLYITVTDPVPGPEIVITGVPITVWEGAYVTLQADVSNAVSYEWDMGDGAWVYPNQAVVEHLFSTEGVYTIRVRAVGSTGLTSTVTGGDVTVVAPSTPIADWSVAKTTVKVGEILEFQNESAFANTYAWDFNLDDPGTHVSTEEDPQTSWDTAGLYSIQLIASDNGNSNTKTEIDYITVEETAEPDRVAGSSVQYYMNEGSGGTVYDSGDGTALNLTLNGAYSRGTDWVTFTGGYAVSSADATKLQSAIAASNEFSVEAWINPATADPASAAVKRILVQGTSVTDPNFDLHQVGDRIRLDIKDTVVTDGERFEFLVGLLPNQTTPYHVVVTRDTNGDVTCWVNNSSTAGGTSQTGNLSNWADGKLALAGREDGSRVWDGDYWLGAVYPFALSLAQVNQNYLAGPGGGVTPPPPTNGPPTGEDGVTTIDWPFLRGTIPSPFLPTRYVDGTLGSDTNDGTSSGAGAWKTLAKMNTDLQAGQACWVAAGTYTDPIAPVADGSATQKIYIFGGDGVTWPPEVTIDLATDQAAIDISGKNYIEVRGFEIAWSTSHNSNWIETGSSKWCCVRNILADSGQTSEQSYDNRANCGGRGVVTYGAEYLWLDNVRVLGALYGMSFGKGGGYVYGSYCKALQCGRNSTTYNSNANGSYDLPNYPYNTMFYRCEYDEIWVGDNVQNVSPGSLVPWENQWAYRNIIYRECVFRRGAENALDLKDSRHIFLIDCMFYGGYGGKGFDDPSDDGTQYASTVMHGAESNGEMYAIKGCIFFDNNPPMVMFGQGNVYAHNTVIHCNRTINGSGDTTELNTRLIGSVGYRRKESEVDQVLVNNIIFDQLNVLGGWNNRSRDRTRIDGNAYGHNTGSGATRWAYVNESSNTWSAVTSLANWQSTLAALSVEGAEANSLEDIAPPFESVPAYPDWEVDGDHRTGGYDFRPVAGHAVLGAAVPVTVTTNSGGTSDTVVAVENPYIFCDGFGIMVPDYVTINGTRIQILSVDFTAKTITLRESGASWSQGTGVYLDYPNIGALDTDSDIWWEEV